MIGGMVACVTQAQVTAEELIAKMYEQTRGLNSYSQLTMRVNRPNWSKTSEFSVWTRGEEDALIRFTAPAKDAGNATLRLGDRMWSYSPVIKRSIRLPKSLLSQEWAGSDFSYRDLARADDMLDHYNVEVTKVAAIEGNEIYTIDAVPLEDAPVVWGKVQLKVRDDNVLLEQVFYDQEMIEVKSLKALEIEEMGGRVIPSVMRMSNMDEPEKWTEIRYDSVDFSTQLDDRLFTQFALRGEL